MELKQVTLYALLIIMTARNSKFLKLLRGLKTKLLLILNKKIYTVQKRYQASLIYIIELSYINNNYDVVE